MAARAALAVAALPLLLLSTPVHACYIQGHDSGVCVEPSVVAANAPFCAGVVTYRSCVPKEYPYYPNHTLANKDAWLQSTYTSVTGRRLLFEGGGYPDDAQPWEGGGPNIAKRFTNNADCLKAYLNYLCYMNFPRCDAQYESLITCRSVCLNYFRACRYPQDMVRCYAPENQGGKEPEDSSNVDPETGLPILLRAPYPGQPFRDGVSAGGQDQPVCTPGLTGGAGTAATAAWAVAFALAAVALAARPGDTAAAEGRSLE